MPPIRTIVESADSLATNASATVDATRDEAAGRRCSLQLRVDSAAFVLYWCRGSSQSQRHRRDADLQPRIAWAAKHCSTSSRLPMARCSLSIGIDEGIGLARAFPEDSYGNPILQAILDGSFLFISVVEPLMCELEKMRAFHLPVFAVKRRFARFIASWPSLTNGNVAFVCHLGEVNQKYRGSGDAKRLRESKRCVDLVVCIVVNDSSDNLSIHFIAAGAVVVVVATRLSHMASCSSRFVLACLTWLHE
jgi:hypothetical protein